VTSPRTFPYHWRVSLTIAPEELAPNRARRLSSSIWMPWVVGLSILLLLGLAAVLLTGRERQVDGVPESIVVAQQRAAQASAQNFRRSTNEAVADLVTASEQLAAAPTAPTSGTLQEMLESQDRWAALLVMSADGAITASAGEKVLLQNWDGSMLPGVGLEVVRILERARIVSHAPLNRESEPTSQLVGLSDTHILNSLLNAGTVGTSYAADPESWVLAYWGPDSVTRDRFTPLDGPVILPDQELRDAADQASQGETVAAVSRGAPGEVRVIAASPISGLGLSGQKGWTMLVERTVSDDLTIGFSLRGPSIIFGFVLIPLTLVIYIWIMLRLLLPIARLRSQSERVAYGDLRQAVEVGPYDEVGRLSRAVERLRLRMIKQRVRRSRPRPPNRKPGE
jgi:HAMP domain-containing protein